jgi:hypothetical protein
MEETFLYKPIRPLLDTYRPGSIRHGIIGRSRLLDKKGVQTSSEKISVVNKPHLIGSGGYANLKLKGTQYFKKPKTVSITNFSNIPRSGNIPIVVQDNTNIPTEDPNAPPQTLPQDTQDTQDPQAPPPSNENENGLVEPGSYPAASQQLTDQQMDDSPAILNAVMDLKSDFQKFIKGDIEDEMQRLRLKLLGVGSSRNNVERVVDKASLSVDNKLDLLAGFLVENKSGKEIISYVDKVKEELVRYIRDIYADNTLFKQKLRTEMSYKDSVDRVITLTNNSLDGLEQKLEKEFERIESESSPEEIQQAPEAIPSMFQFNSQNRPLTLEGYMKSNRRRRQQKQTRKKEKDNFQKRREKAAIRKKEAIEIPRDVLRKKQAEGMSERKEQRITKPKRKSGLKSFINIDEDN